MFQVINWDCFQTGIYSVTCDHQLNLQERRFSTNSNNTSKIHRKSLQKLPEQELKINFN